MPDHIKRYESLLFNNETTSRTDYRDGEIKSFIKTVYRHKQVCPRPSPVPLKDLHALTPWKGPHVPFDLYHRPKEVLRTNPRNIQERYELPVDDERAVVQKSRPKVVMTPALELDGVEEPIRQKFVDAIYISSTIKSWKDGLSRSELNDVRAPLLDVYAPSNPIKIEPLLDPYVSPEWRMKSVSWDNRQMRSYTEPTKEFWLSREFKDFSKLCLSKRLQQNFKQQYNSKNKP